MFLEIKIILLTTWLSKGAVENQIYGARKSYGQLLFSIFLFYQQKFGFASKDLM